MRDIRPAGSRWLSSSTTTTNEEGGVAHRIGQAARMPDAVDLARGGEVDVNARPLLVQLRVVGEPVHQ